MKDPMQHLWALVRVELRGLLPFAFGVALCAVFGCAYLRYGMDLHAPLGSPERMGLLRCTALLSGIPIVAAAFDPPGARGLRRALQPMPIKGTFLAKVLATWTALAATAAVTSAADAVLAAAAPAPESSALSFMLADRNLHAIVLGVGAFAWLSTLFVSTLIQHALGATLLGFAAGALPFVVLSHENPSELEWSMTFGLFAELGPYALCAVSLVILWAISTITPLRGPRGRSLLRRTPRAAALPVMLLSIPAASFAARTLLSPPPTWEDPSARIESCLISPDRKWLAVSLVHPDPRTRWQSFWLVDTETYGRREIPHPSTAAAALLRPSIQMATWTKESDGIVFWEHANGRGGDRQFSGCFDLEEGWGPLGLGDEFHSGLLPLVQPGGWQVRMNRDENGIYYTLRSVIDPDLEPIHVGNQHPTFPSAMPYIAVAVSRAGEFITCDSRTGAIRMLGLNHAGDLNGIFVSPELRWLSWVDGERRTWLAEVATGEVHEHGGPPHQLTDRDLPMLHAIHPGGKHELLGPNGAKRPLPLPAGVYPQDLDGERWFARERRARLSILADDGSLLKELRSGPGEAQ